MAKKAYASFFNKKLGRAIRELDPMGTTFLCYRQREDPIDGYEPVYAPKERQEAFDWLHGKDAETAKVKREEKLRIVAEKIRADAELIIKTCEENDGWLEHLYQDRHRNLSDNQNDPPISPLPLNWQHRKITVLHHSPFNDPFHR